ncbi:MAG: outer membrane beta-barrel protein [Vicinamibacterales bacterium]
MKKNTFYSSLVVVALSLGAATSAHAQGYVSPFIGYDFGGDSGCPAINGCADKKVNAGIALGSFGPLLGFEVEFGYANDFFGDAPEFSSSVLTVMANALVGPKIGPVRPYGTGGFGLIKTRVDLTAPSLISSSNNHLGWNLGGGLMVFAGDHVGIRGEIRRFHALQDLAVPWLPLDGTTLNFNRASAALMLMF